MFPKKTVPLLPLLFFTLSSAPALADDPSAKIQTTPESGLLRGLADDLESRREQIETNSGLRKKNAAAQEESEDIPDLDDEDLKKHPELANRVLNAAMLSEDWDTLEHVSGFYHDIPGHDPVLDAYVRGALLRAQVRLGKAAKVYRDILRQHPDLSYVRLDLAGMLFENRAYKDATKEFEQAKREDIEPEAAAQADAYLAAVKQADPWQIRLRGGWQYGNNTNNATSNDYFLWPFAVVGSITYYYKLPRDPESLPHSGSGISYGAQIGKDTNLAGNHNIGFNLEAEGVRYPHWRDDDEFSLSLDAGYKSRTLNNTFALTPRSFPPHGSAVANTAATPAQTPRFPAGQPPACNSPARTPSSAKNTATNATPATTPRSTASPPPPSTPSPQTGSPSAASASSAKKPTTKKKPPPAASPISARSTASPTAPTSASAAATSPANSPTPPPSTAASPAATAKPTPTLRCGKKNGCPAASPPSWNSPTSKSEATSTPSRATKNRSPSRWKKSFEMWEQSKQAV